MFDPQLVLFYLSMPEFAGVGDGSILVFFVPLFHGYGFGLMYSIICNKATAIVMKSFDPQVFCESVQRYRVNMIPLVPPVMVFLAKHPMIANYDFSSVKEIVCGAAPLSDEVSGPICDGR